MFWKILSGNKSVFLAIRTFFFRYFTFWNLKTNGFLMTFKLVSNEEV